MNDHALHYRPGRRVVTMGARRSRGIAIAVGYVLAAVVLLRWVPTSLHTGVLVCVAAGPWALAVSSRRSIAAFNQALQPGLARLREGDPARAEIELRSVVSRFGWPRFLRRMALYNVGQALLRQGKLGEALEALVRSDETGGWFTIDGALAASLSMVHALEGRVEIAEVWLEEAKRRYAHATTKHPYAFLQAEILLLLRKGRFSAVEERLDAEWSQIEYAMKGESLRPLSVLRAFATYSGGDYRRGGALHPSLAQLETLRPGELDYLGASWPELARFLAEHGPRGR
jgi:hypothetical protein